MVRLLFDSLFSFLYQILLGIGVIFLLPFFLLKEQRRKPYHTNWKERLGFFAAEKRMRHCIWIHAVSVGEVLVVKPLIEKMKKEFPSLSILLSTTTPTGQVVAREKIVSAFPDCVLIFAPLDFIFVLKRVFIHFHPSALVLVETELWPMMLSLAKKRDIPTFLINARVSRSSARSYKLLRPWFKDKLDAISHFLVQTQEYANRFETIGVPRQKIQVAGNLKYTVLDLLKEGASEKAKHLRDLFSLYPKEPVLIGGSTHKGEEKVLLQIFSKISEAPATLILAPRHPERFKDVIKIVEENGFSARLRSKLGHSEGDRCTLKQVILLDSMGELLPVYHLATVVFVGKSLFPPGGGHNILEPASLGKTTLFGPYMQNFAEIRNYLLENSAALEVRNIEELAQKITLLLSNEKERYSLEINALSLSKMGNAVERTFQPLRALCAAASRATITR